MRHASRRVAAAAVIALLGPATAAFANPPAQGAIAHRAAAPVAPSLGHVKHHRTARLCSAVPQVGRASCFAIRQTDTVQPAGVSPDAVSPYALPSGFGPSSLAAAYKLDQSKGSGQTVAIVDANDDPHAESDLGAYRTQYGLPPCTTANGCFKKISQTGSSTILPAPDASWAAEISLDVDMVSATCPNCKILLVEADSSFITDLGVAVNKAVLMGAKYVSNSYGGPETGSQGFDEAYYHHVGVAITASAGDRGYGAMYPATGAFVTAVGGTSLTSANNSRGWAEQVWNNTASQATGSGCSSYVAKPSFQAKLTTGCNYRAEADVSAVADPNTGVAVFDTYGKGFTGWNVFGGTSASSPIIASVYALADALGATSDPNTYPYLHAANLFDVTSGTNGTCSPTVLCHAGPGWDGPTGLGTPNGTAAFGGVSINNPGSQTGAVGSPQSLQIQADDSVSGAQLSYAATGLPSGLTIDPVTGLISGPGAAGSANVTVTATDTAAAVSDSATFSWVIQAPASLVTMSPLRVLDTRSGIGAPAAPVGPGADLVLQITGRGSVPGHGVSAVVVNVTVTGPTSTGYLAAFPDGSPQPGVSNLDFVAGQTVANLAIVPVGNGGAIRLHNGGRGSVQLVADISGYFLAGAPSPPGGLAAVTPTRLLDTRIGKGAPPAAVAPGADLVLQITGRGGVSTRAVSAVVVNLTVTGPTSAGYVAAFPDGSPVPGVSNLDFVAGQTVPNLAIVPVGASGAIRLHNGSHGAVQLIADVSGYFLAGTPSPAGGLVAVTPTRLLDTRSGAGSPAAPVGPGEDLVLQITGNGPVPASAASAVVVNVTVTGPTSTGWLAAFPADIAWPGVSNLDFVGRQTVPNLAIVPVSAAGAIRLRNGSPGTVQLVADVSGYFAR